MSYDFSSRSDLVGLAQLTHSLQAVAEPMGVAHFLMGAAARDLMLKFAHDIQSLRATEDADFAVMVPNWNEFEALRKGLIAVVNSSYVPGPPHIACATTTDCHSTSFPSAASSVRIAPSRGRATVVLSSTVSASRKHSSLASR